MSSKKLHLALIASLGLLFIALVGGTYEANTYLGKKANDLTALKAKSQALSQEEISLVQAKKGINQYADLTKIARSVVPEDKSQAEAVREIVNIADANGIKLSSISFPSSTLGGVLGKPGTAATATPSPAAAANTKTNSLSQLVPVIGLVGVYQLSINVDSDTTAPITYPSFINFLSSLEHNRRTAQVSTISIQPNKINPSLLTFSLTLNEYIKP